MSANFISERRDPSSGETPEQLPHGRWLPLGCRQLANQSAPDPTRVEIKLVKKECLG